MSVIIIGDPSLEQQLKDNQSQVAPFRLQKMLNILAKYDAGTTLSDGEVQFLLRCAADIEDNQ